MKSIKILFVLFILIFGCDSVQNNWKDALDQNTISAYEYFIKQNPTSIYVDSAINKIWHLAELANTIEVYERCLAKYDTHYYLALSRIWNLTKAKHTLRGYDEFLNKYPNSSFSEEAITLIWDIIRQASNLKSYEYFIKKYPNSPCYEQALKASWLIVKEDKSIGGLESFITAFPDSEYAVLAKEEIKNVFSSTIPRKPSATINSNLSVAITISTLAGADSYKLYWTKSLKERISESQSLIPNSSNYSLHWPDDFPVYYYVVALKDGVKSKISSPFTANLKSSNNGKKCQLCGETSIGYCSDRRIYVCKSHNVYTKRSGGRVRCP
jgi:hypothetical protein